MTKGEAVDGLVINALNMRRVLKRLLTVQPWMEKT